MSVHTGDHTHFQLEHDCCLLSAELALIEWAKLFVNSQAIVSCNLKEKVGTGVESV